MLLCVPAIAGPLAHGARHDGTGLSQRPPGCLTPAVPELESLGVKGRIQRLRRLIAGEGIDGMLITDLSNIRYLCGYSGSNGAMLVTPRSAWFYTDFRYKEQVRTEVRGCRSRVLARGLLLDFPTEHIAGIRTVGVESHHLTLQSFRLLRRRLRGNSLVPVQRNLVLELRRTKDRSETAAIRNAQRVTDRVFLEVLASVKPGIREKELAAEITYRFEISGENAFDPIVASGPNGAKPHAGATGRRLKKGDAVTFDIGCRVNGYCADMTRTVFLGKPDSDLAEVYSIVLEAQRRALETIRAGTDCAEVDRVARDHIRDTGYGPYFGHSLGHGVGIDVHEQPVLAGTSGQQLEPGDMVTVEPGIYLPGLGGVRIEDMVSVTETGCRNLTKSPKDLIRL